MLVVAVLAVLALALTGWTSFAWWERRACERLPERGEPRYGTYLRRYGPAKDGTDDNLDGAAAYVGKSNDVARRFAEHDDVHTWDARGRRWKERVETEKSTVIRWCRTEQHALDVEERIILAFATAVRLFGPLLRRQRWLPNQQHNRAPKDAEEWACALLWICWYGLFPVVEYRARRLLRLPSGPGSKDDLGQPGIDGRWLWPWPKNGREPLVQTPPPVEDRVRTRAGDPTSR